MSNLINMIQNNFENSRKKNQKNSISLKLHNKSLPLDSLNSSYRLFLFIAYFMLKKFIHTSHKSIFFYSLILLLSLYIINYIHFKFSTKQLIMLINTFQSTDKALIINLSPLYSFSLFLCQNWQVWRILIKKKNRSIEK